MSGLTFVIPQDREEIWLRLDVTCRSKRKQILRRRLLGMTLDTVEELL